MEFHLGVAKLIVFGGFYFAQIANSIFMSLSQHPTLLYGRAVIVTLSEREDFFAIRITLNIIFVCLRAMFETKKSVLSSRPNKKVEGTTSRIRDPKKEKICLEFKTKKTGTSRFRDQKNKETEYEKILSSILKVLRNSRSKKSFLFNIAGNEIRVMRIAEYV